MSKLYLIFWSVFLAGHMTAQTDSIPNKKDNLYIGWGVTYPLGGEVSAGRFGHRGWGVSMGFNSMSRKAVNKPYGYDGGNSLFGQGSDEIEKDNLNIFSVRAMKLFKLNPQHNFFSIEVGPSYVHSVIARDFRPVIDPCTVDPFFGATWCKANFTYNRTAVTGMGLSIKANIKTAFSSLTGMEIGFESNLNSEWSYFGFDALFLIGRFK